MTVLENMTETRKRGFLPLCWQGTDASLQPVTALPQLLRQTDQPIVAIQAQNGRIGFSTDLLLSTADGGNDANVLALLPPIAIKDFGDPTFLQEYGLRAAYYAGAMANGIASAEMVIALGKAGLMGSFGAGGLSPARIEAAIQQVQAALPEGPYAFNLLHNPYEPAIERATVELYLRYEIPVVEAAAYIQPSDSLVRYRAAGLRRGLNDEVIIGNRVIAKVSRREVAHKFISPAPDKALARLLAEGLISPEQAELAALVPLADDLSVEADSGGHTDNRPLVCLLPSMIALRNELQAQYQYQQPVRVGIGGGISTPESVLAAFQMGAAYVFTGSINHASVEAATSAFTKQQLALAAMTDVTMAPSADMFEMGVNVQVLKRGTMYAMRARKLYELYTRFNSIGELPAKDRETLETSIFKRSLDDVWAETQTFFQQRDPTQIEKAMQDGHKQMALIFRWYLGLASRWSCSGEPERESDYQVWCGPAMGAFNDWVRGSELEALENRGVVRMADALMLGCAYRYRVQNLRAQGIVLPGEFDVYRP
jgi:trans-AT polyketide synthase, acyltransferase and oxidoreductase domains